MIWEASGPSHFVPEYVKGKNHLDEIILKRKKYWSRFLPIEVELLIRKKFQTLAVCAENYLHEFFFLTLAFKLFCTWSMFRSNAVDAFQSIEFE